MNRKLPFVSIVIPLYNSSTFLRPCLDSVLKTKYPFFEIVLVDDLSTDNTVEIIEKEYAKYKNIRLIKNNIKKLAAGSRNNGFLHAKGEFVALLDHDVQVDPDWIMEMVKIAIKDTSIGIVQGEIFDYTKRKVLQCVGVKLFPQVCWVASLGQGLLEKNYKVDPHVVAAATGILYVKEAFLLSGGFDEKLGINLDDIDLNWRMWVIGYKTVVASKSITYHWSKKQKIRDAWINRFRWEFHYAKVPRVFIKNYSTIDILRYLPIFFIVANLRGIFNIIFRFNFAPLVGLWGSLLWNIYYLPDTLYERGKIEKKRKFKDSELMRYIFINEPIIVIFIKFWLPIVKIGRKLSTESIQ